MARGQHVLLPAGQIAHAQRTQVALGVQFQGFHTLAKAHFAAQGNDLGTHVFHHFHQAEGANVRVGGVQNFGRRTGIDKLLQHLAPQVARVFDLAVELAVGKRPGAAFTKLHVAFGVELALAPQAPGVLRALAHGLATLEHDGLEAHLRQHQRGKNAAGAKAHHHGALGQRGRGLHGRLPGHVGRGLDVRVLGVLRQQGNFLARVGQLHIDDVHRLHTRAARVETALEHVQLGNGTGGHAQGLGSQGVQLGQGVDFAMVFGVLLHGSQGNFELGQADHAGRIALAGQPCRRSRLCTHI